MAKSVSNRLVPAAGSCYAHLFENEARGIPRALYWSFTITFQPAHDCDADWDASIACDWIVWPATSSGYLADMSLANAVGAVKPESSVYLFNEHHEAQITQLEVLDCEDAHVTIEMAATANLPETSACETFVSQRIVARATLDWEGIIVVPGNLAENPTEARRAAKLLAQYWDLTDLRLGVWDRHRWVFAPL